MPPLWHVLQERVEGLVAQLLPVGPGELGGHVLWRIMPVPVRSPSMSPCPVSLPPINLHVPRFLQHALHLLKLLHAILVGPVKVEETLAIFLVPRAQEIMQLV